jgi:hypothetical protein
MLSRNAGDFVASNDCPPQIGRMLLILLAPTAFAAGSSVSAGLSHLERDALA